MTKLVVVFTATGLQGSAICRYLLEHAKDIYRVRALTRDANQRRSKELASLGAEVVEYSLDDDESVRKAVSGANVIFGNTDFWSVYSVEAEVKQAARILQAADELPELEHFVQSAFPDAPKLSGGRFNSILHYNAKNEINRLSADKYPKLWAKTTCVWVGYYFDNWIKFNFPFGPQKISDGVFELPVPYAPSTRVSCSNPGDLGIVFHAIVSRGQKYHGKTVSLFSSELPDDEKLKIWADALGIQATFKEVTAEEYTTRMETAMPLPIAKNVTEQLLIIGTRGNYISQPDVVNGTEIVDKSYHFKTWEEYVKETDWSSIL